MRFIYNLLAYLLYIPFGLYWTVRAIWNPNYRPKIGQRFGFGYPKLERCIWIHAVSVGEAVAAEPLIRALQRAFPERPLLVTTVTPTGAARVRKSFGDSVVHCYIPFETPFAVNRFFHRVDPTVALILETEIWPNLYHGCGIRDIPLVLVSARISPRSVKSYRRLLPLFRETLSHGIVIAAQSKADAKRFVSLGASKERTRVTGNIKFDIEVDPGLRERGQRFRQQNFGDRLVWVAASTHDGEERAIIDAHASLLQTFPELLLVLVPRHPERFDSVAELIASRNLNVVRRTEHRPCDRSTAVFLGDTMGEMMLFYAAADIAFVGGSLTPIGGHNLLEPAALGLPIITGPYMFNAQEIADLFLRREARRQVSNAAELTTQVLEFLKNPETAREQGRAAASILNQNRGALHELLDVVEPLIRNQG